MSSVFKKACALVRGRIMRQYRVRKLTVTNTCHPPQHTGQRGYWTTPKGKPIRNPRGYPWPKIYHKTTYQVTVGSRWVERAATLPAGYSWQIDCDYLWIVCHRSKKRITGNELPDVVELRAKTHRLKALFQCHTITQK